MALGAEWQKSPPRSGGPALDYDNAAVNGWRTAVRPSPSPHHFHVLSHKHNTHITLTRPNRDPIMSFSAGNLGFKKAARGSYDAAYQLATYVLSRMQNSGILNSITEIEVVLRGFGQGREAVTKALLGGEAHDIRSRLVRLTDATRLKFGGTRSKKPRRV